MGDVVGASGAFDGDAVDEPLLAFRAHRMPLLFAGGVGADEAGGDAVDGDAEGAEFVGKLADEADLSRFGGGVGLDSGEADAEAGAAGR